MIAAMMWRSISLSDWRSQAPRWTAAVLAGFVVLQICAIAMNLRAAAPEPLPVQAVTLRPLAPPVSARRIAKAHLFGVETVPEQTAANAPQTRLPLALSGVIAMKDPSHGYAILGEKGTPTHLYWTGASLGPGRNLYQVFADRVVLQIDGRFEVLKFPQQSRAGLSAVVATSADEAPETQTAQTTPQQSHEPPTPAESWFGNLNAEPEHDGGKLTGMLLHPAGRYQRRFGLRNGDVLTAVNGTEITDTDSLTQLLKTSPNTMSLTFIRDGVQRTVSAPVNE